MLGLEDKISSDDIESVNNSNNHSDFEDGFGDDSSFGGGEDDGFTLDDLFGSDGGSNDSFGSDNSFGFDNSFGGNGGFGTNDVFGNTQQTKQEPDTIDKMIDGFIEASKGIFDVLMEACKSISLRTADDFGFYSKTLILVGLIMAGVAVIIGVMGVTLSVRELSFVGIPLHLILAGVLMVPTGITGIGIASMVLFKKAEKNEVGIDKVGDIPDSEENHISEYEDSLDEQLDDLFGGDFDSLFDDEDSNTEDSLFSLNDDEEDDRDRDETYQEEINYEEKLESIHSNLVLDRKILFDTFKKMLPNVTPNYSKQTKIDKDSNDFTLLQTTCLRALANIANTEIEETGSYLESATDTLLSTTLRLKRIKKVKKVEELARELEIYLRDDSNDESINVNVSMEQDFYKIIISKGETPIISFGDIFKDKKICDYFLNEKKMFPIITGIDDLGNVLYEDAKNFDSMLIAGKPRSGKSWYVLSILLSLMLFNSPELVQFCIVDPKKSSLFKNLSLMPHVCGLHDDSYILDILDELIKIESLRRAKLLEDNDCDTIWELWDKGIKVPVLYLVIDEYITVVNNLDKEDQKELNNKLQTFITRLPSQGIRLIFVPHRATGIVDKTNRTMIQYTAAVRATNEEIIDTLDIKKWDRALTKPGDIALKTSTMRNARYVRGIAVTKSDAENSKFIINAAKAFYKMGVDLPDMSNLKVIFNRDEEYIKDKLYGDVTNIQYSADKVKQELDSTEL